MTARVCTDLTPGHRLALSVDWIEAQVNEWRLASNHMLALEWHTLEPIYWSYTVVSILFVKNKKKEDLLGNRTCKQLVLVHSQGLYSVKAM